MIVKTLSFTLFLGHIERIYEVKGLEKNEKRIIISGESDFESKIYTRGSEGYSIDADYVPDEETLLKVNVIINGEEQCFYNIDNDYIEK